MTTFLLVPGAGLGAEAFDDVVAGLVARGHTATAISLRGLGERFDDADPATDLNDHVDDVAAAVGERHGVVLVGHSYAASVIWEATQQLEERVTHVMLLGAVPPPVGTSAFDQLPAEGQQQVAALADAEGDGWRLPPFTRDLLDAVWDEHGFDDATYARYQQLAAGHPLATLQTPMTVAIDTPTPARQTYIVCLGDPDPTPELPHPWQRALLDTGHWPMLTAPKALVDLLEQLTTP
ncbi:MAG: alpha/beta hydrolase [Nitriliruptoraceae bacterium]